MPVFVPCPSCSRHIATSENACPFCSTAITEDLSARAIPGTNRRMSRLAMFTFASTATAVGTLAACSSSSNTSAVPLYGAACTDCGTLSDGGSTNDSGGIQPSYGAAFFDSGVPFDAASADDAGEDAD